MKQFIQASFSNCLLDDFLGVFGRFLILLNYHPELQQQAAEREDRINTAESAVRDAEKQQKLFAEERDEISAKITAMESRLENVEAERGRIADSILEKESLIQSLSQEVESLRTLQQQQPQQQQEAPLHPEVGAFGVDVAESNRPPPDVTQGQNSSQQPDVAGPSPHFGGQGQPDLMPNAALEQIDLVQSPADFFNQPGPAAEAEDGQNQAGFAYYFGASEEDRIGQFFAPQEQQNQPGYFDAFAQPRQDPQPLGDEPNQRQQEVHQQQHEVHQHQQEVLPQDPVVNQERVAAERDAEIQQQIVAELERERDELSAKCSTVESRLENVEAERRAIEESVVEKEAKIQSLSQELETLQSAQQQQHQQAEEAQGQPDAGAAVGAEAAPPLEQGTPDQAVQQYQAELASYQQAITDWQAWAETQNTEVATLQQSLAEYTEAHAVVTQQVEELRAQSQSSGSESDTLKAKLRAKELEVTDLGETLDRLRCEKEDLEQEVGELSRRNAEVASSDDSHDNGIEMAVYEELKASHEDLLNERERVNNELQNARQENEDLKGEKGKLQTEITGLNEKVATGSRDIEVKEDRIASLVESMEQDQHKIQELESEKSKLLSQIEELRQKVTESNNERERELAAKLDNAQAELEGLRNEGGDVAQYQAAIAEWQAWHESQTVEFERLQGSIRQLTQDCQKVEEEKGKLEEESREKDEMLKNKDDEIEQLKELREDELESVKNMREDNQLQQAAIGGEMKEQLMAQSAEVAALQKSLEEYTEAHDVVTQQVEELRTERDQALADLQSSKGEVVQLQDRQSGLEAEVANIYKDKDEEAKRVSSLKESREQLQAQFKELEAQTAQAVKYGQDKEDEAVRLLKEKKSLLEQIEEMEQKQNNLLSDGENQLKEELERVRSEMDALKTKAEDVSQYHTAIADWQAWANTQTAEFAKLQENLQQYTEAYTKAVEENARLLAESQEKDKDIAALKSTTSTDEEDDESPLRRENDRLNARLDIMRSKFSELEATSTELRTQLGKAESSLADLSEKNENLTGMYRVSHLLVDWVGLA